MTTHFITAEVELQQTPQQLQKEIESRLKQEGQPLRWAVTEVNKEKQTAKVEAIVTKES